MLFFRPPTRPAATLILITSRSGSSGNPVFSGFNCTCRRTVADRSCRVDAPLCRSIVGVLYDIPARTGRNLLNLHILLQMNIGGCSAAVALFVSLANVQCVQRLLGVPSVRTTGFGISEFRNFFVGFDVAQIGTTEWIVDGDASESSLGELSRRFNDFTAVLAAQIEPTNVFGSLQSRNCQSIFRPRHNRLKRCN